MDLITIFLTGLLISFFANLTTGTLSLLSLTTLFTMGIPPYLAIAIHRFGTFGSSIGGLYTFYKHKKIDWDLVWKLCLISVPSGYLGAQIILSIDPIFISKIVGVAILIFIPISLMNQFLGVKQVVVSKSKKTWGYLCYFITTVWGSSFNVGVGIPLVYIMNYFFGKTILEARANNKIPGIIRSSIGIMTFFIAGIVDFKLGIAYASGMLVGATFGTKCSIKMGNEYLRKILLVTIFGLAIKLVFFP